MNYLRFFQTFALCFLTTWAARAEGTDPAAGVRVSQASLACAPTEASARGYSGPAPDSYALVHAGSGPEMFGFSLSGLRSGPSDRASLVRSSEMMRRSALLPSGCCRHGAEMPQNACQARIGARGYGAGVAELLENIAARDATVSILRTLDGDALRLETPQGPRLFAIPDLYIVRGILRHRDRVSDTELGRIVAVR